MELWKIMISSWFFLQVPQWVGFKSRAWSKTSKQQIKKLQQCSVFLPGWLFIYIYIYIGDNTTHSTTHLFFGHMTSHKFPGKKFDRQGDPCRAELGSVHWSSHTPCALLGSNILRRDQRARGKLGVSGGVGIGFFSGEIVRKDAMKLKCTYLVSLKSIQN